jgi:hypothetical protein
MPGTRKVNTSVRLPWSIAKLYSMAVATLVITANPLL